MEDVSARIDVGAPHVDIKQQFLNFFQMRELQKKELYKQVVVVAGLVPLCGGLALAAVGFGSISLGLLLPGALLFVAGTLILTSVPTDEFTIDGELQKQRTSHRIFRVLVGFLGLAGGISYGNSVCSIAFSAIIVIFGLTFMYYAAVGNPRFKPKTTPIAISSDEGNSKETPWSTFCIIVKTLFSSDALLLALYAIDLVTGAAERNYVYYVSPWLVETPIAQVLSNGIPQAAEYWSQNSKDVFDAVSMFRLVDASLYTATLILFLFYMKKHWKFPSSAGSSSLLSLPSDQQQQQQSVGGVTAMTPDDTQWTTKIVYAYSRIIVLLIGGLACSNCGREYTLHLYYERIGTPEAYPTWQANVLAYIIGACVVLGSFLVVWFVGEATFSKKLFALVALLFFDFDTKRLLHDGSQLAYLLSQASVIFEKNSLTAGQYYWIFRKKPSVSTTSSNAASPPGATTPTTASIVASNGSASPVPGSKKTRIQTIDRSCWILGCVVEVINANGSGNSTSTTPSPSSDGAVQTLVVQCSMQEDMDKVWEAFYENESVQFTGKAATATTNLGSNTSSSNSNTRTEEFHEWVDSNFRFNPEKGDRKDEVKQEVILHIPITCMEKDMLLTWAKQNFRKYEYKPNQSDIHSILHCRPNDLSEPEKRKLWEYSKEMQKVNDFNKIDYFISHSWADNWKLKADSLLRFMTRSRRFQRYPSIWLDKVCINQVNPGQAFNVLPINIGACKKILVLFGTTYLQRLWCVWELFTILAFCNKELIRERVELVFIDDTSTNNLGIIKRSNSSSNGSGNNLSTPKLHANQSFIVQNPIAQSSSSTSSGTSSSTNATDVSVKEEQRDEEEEEELAASNFVKQLKSFEINQAHCFDPNEEYRLRQVMHAIDIKKFTQKIHALASIFSDHDDDGRSS